MTIAAVLLAWQSWAFCLTGPDCWLRGFTVGVNVGSKYDLDGDRDLDLLDYADWVIGLTVAATP